MNDKKLEASTEIKVEFYDVDSMNVVWHGNYIKYFETARCVLLDKLNYGYSQMKEDGFSFPVVSIKVKYIRPLFFGEEVVVKAVLAEYENCLKISYYIYDKKSGMLTTKGESVQMAFDMKKMESVYVLPPRVIENVRNVYES